MHQNNRHMLWEPGDHPAVELLRQYHEDTLPPALQHQLERHLLDCALCSDVLEGISISDAEKTQAAVKGINQHIAAITQKKKRKPLPVYLTDWRVAAAILLVLCSTILVFYYNYKEIRQKQSIATSDTDKAIQEAMDLSKHPAVVNAESIANVTPDTVKEKPIAAVAPPTRQLKQTAPAVVSDQRADVARIATVQETKTDVFSQEPIKLTDAPAITKTTDNGESVAATGYNNKTAFAPETTSVARALQGKAAGVRIRGIGTLPTKQVQGQVLSSDGQPLPGVSVTVKGTNSGVATDANGNFTINLPKNKTTLAFNFIGYETEERSISAGTQNLTVNLNEDTKALSEVVATGYGTTKAQPPVVIDAKPVAGMRAFKKYLEENIRYTSESEKGRVEVQFTVSPAGALQNLQVVKSLCTSCDAEAIRLIKEGPAWKPATKDGINVEQQVKIKVRFRPQNKN